MVAYGFVAVVVFIVILCGITFILCAPVVNALIDCTNTQIEHNDLSQGMYNTFTWDIKLFEMIPVIGLFGIFLWGIIRALEER